jgi:hypothetical protein
MSGLFWIFLKKQTNFDVYTLKYNIRYSTQLGIAQPRADRPHGRRVPHHPRSADVGGFDPSTDAILDAGAKSAEITKLPLPIFGVTQYYRALL